MGTEQNDQFTTLPLLSGNIILPRFIQNINLRNLPDLWMHRGCDGGGEGTENM